MKSKTNRTILKTNLQKLYKFSSQKGQIRIRYSYSESDRIRIHNTGYWQEYNIRLGSGSWAEKWTCQGGGTPSAPTWSRSTLNSSMRRWCKPNEHLSTEMSFPSVSLSLAIFWFYWKKISRHIDITYSGLYQLFFGLFCEWVSGRFIANCDKSDNRRLFCFKS